MNSSANIGTSATLPIDTLSNHSMNPRMGDVSAIKQSMLTNGIFRPIVVNKGTHTGRTNEVLAGNHSLKAMRELAQEHPEDTRWHNIDVWLIDVDEEHATRIVLADNRTADLGRYDNDILLELLDNLDGDYLGTGYDEDDIGRLLGEEIPDDWQPEQPLADPDLASALIALERTNPDTVIIFNQPGNLQQLTAAAHSSGWCTEVNTDRLKIWPNMRS